LRWVSFFFGGFVKVLVSVLEVDEFNGKEAKQKGEGNAEGKKQKKEGGQRRGRGRGSGREG
jgi:hypothetical protein